MKREKKQLDKATNKGSQSLKRQEFLELMSKLDFGSIQNLRIEDGDPVMGPDTSVTCDIKLGTESVSRSEDQKEDFLLTKQVIKLFEHFSKINNGMIKSLEVRHRQPFRLILEEPPIAAGNSVKK